MLFNSAKIQKYLKLDSDKSIVIFILLEIIGAIAGVYLLFKYGEW